MATDSRYVDIGDVVRLCRQFLDEAGEPANPDAVALTVRDGNGVVSSVTPHEVTDPDELAVCASLMGVSLDEGTGVWTATVEPDSAGLWRYRWAGTGAVTSAEEGSFHVRRRRVL